MKIGEKYIFKFRGKDIPVQIVAILEYGIECEFLQSCAPVEKGERMICNTAMLYPEGAK